MNETVERQEGDWVNTYEDNRRVGELSEMSTEVLKRMMGAYATFLQRQDIMPRARAVATRVKTHVEFEIAYRAGHFERSEDGTVSV